ncbi:iron-sulfur cluster assembly scaffold protein [Candidatus Babeliales bacterium]|nr:iron-sulfur cluster assembly scaffold protein [Candidatus Babeliales bacterium]
MADLYKEELMDHYKNPRNYGELKDSDFSAEDDNPACGDYLSIQGKLNGRTVSKLNFMGKGCVLSQATASILFSKYEGKGIGEILSLTKEDILKMIGIDIGPVRIKCVLLPLQVLQKALKPFSKNL